MSLQGNVVDHVRVNPQVLTGRGLSISVKVWGSREGGSVVVGSPRKGREGEKAALSSRRAQVKGHPRLRLCRQRVRSAKRHAEETHSVQ